MDSSEQEDRKTIILNKWLRSPTTRLMHATKLLLAIAVAPDLVKEEKRKAIILDAQKALEDANAEMN